MQQLGLAEKRAREREDIGVGDVVVECRLGEEEEEEEEERERKRMMEAVHWR